jgi:hypothetical protein
LSRFKNRDINFYHVLKSLVYFEDAEEEPNPILAVSGEDWEWKNVKIFFEKHLKEFEEYLLRNV